MDFAHRDAEIFASYLKSKSGGSIPEENIRLLLNENATFTAMYSAIQWLVDVCSKDDLVYFYFSGHGDKESVTIRNLGYLLSYNTPRTNYVNNALRIEDLNDYANALSVKNNARVILITDACHSGKLAGNENRGTFLVGDQLRTVLNNEIRMTSSGPEELSNEDPGWGGGRGVFSYYLINGLEGLAEKNNDGIITVGEIRGYLESTLSKDPLLAQKENKQNPVVKGNDNFKLAVIDPARVTDLKQKGLLVGSSGSNNEVELAPVPKQPLAYFFDAFKEMIPEEIVDFRKLNELPKDAIPVAFMNAIKSNETIKIDEEKFEELKVSLRNNQYTLKRFTSKLVELLVDRTQSIINLYLEGDEAELERRRYYNSKSSGYDIYPEMLSMALKLIPPDDRLYKKIQIKYHYFSGIVARLKIPLVKEYTVFLNQALEEQKKAFALEENAAYINNELGILSKYKKQDALAEQYYKRATQIAPQWVIPQANLLGLYATTNRFDQGLTHFKKAMELQPRFQGVYLNGGLLYESQKQLLMAEELFRRSIDINSRHYLPFERLGYVYMNTTQYAIADSFFYEADLRKRGYHFFETEVYSPPIAESLSLQVVSPCEIDTLKLAKNDVLGHFVYAVQAYENRDLKTAERFFKKTIAINNTNPLVYHFLGKLLYGQGRWQEGDVIFNLAIKNFLDPDSFRDYYTAQSKLIPASKLRDCLVDGFRLRYYDKMEDYYFLATLYEQWNHYSEAESVYRTIISLTPGSIGGYYKLWNMLERLERNKDAEIVIMSFDKYDKKASEEELIAFYRRMTEKYLQEPDWFYKAGTFLYHIAKRDPEAYKDEAKKIVPDTDGERMKQAGDTHFGMRKRVRIELPGINELVSQADHITQPKTDAIPYLLKADSLYSPGSIVLADINYKIGDLYVWMGLIVKASPYYQKSVDLQPVNSGARLKLIDTYSQTYYYQSALIHLDTLYNRKEINYPKLIMLATYKMQDGVYEKATALLKEAQTLYPFKMAEIDDLNGRVNLLANKPKLALPFYQSYLNAMPNDYSTMYTIAKLYALTGNQAEAWKWLEKAVDKGFRYSWILKFDQAWDKFRLQAKWKSMINRYPMKSYPEPEDSRLLN